MPAITPSDRIYSLSLIDSITENSQRTYAFSFMLVNTSTVARLVTWQGKGSREDRKNHTIDKAYVDELVQLFNREDLKPLEAATPDSEEAQEIYIDAEIERMGDGNVPDTWENSRRHLRAYFKADDPQYLALKQQITAILEKAINRL